MEFDCTAAGRDPLHVDGDSRAGPSPVELLLIAAASCCAADVVAILGKQRVALRSLEVEARGTRREQPPRRFVAIHFRFTLTAASPEESKTRRAIDLSLERYCSVVASLAPDTRVTYDVTIA